LVARFHDEAGSRLRTALIIAMVVGWLFVVSFSWRCWQLFDFDLTIRVAVQTQHCMEVPVDQ